MTYSVERFPSVKAAKVLFDKAKDWPKKGSLEYDNILACDSLFRYAKLKNRIVVYGVYDKKGELMAIMPMRPMVDGTIEIAGSYERLDFVDFIYHPKAKKSEVAKFFYEYCKKELKAKRFYSRFVPVTSPTFKAAEKMKKFKGLRTWENGNINIEFDSYEDYFQTLSKHAKQNLRTAYNRAERDGKKIELVCYHGDTKTLRKDSKIRKDLDECMKLYTERQLSSYVKNKVKTFAFRIKNLQYFSISSKMNKRGYVAILKIDGKIAAFMHGFYNPFDKAYEIPRLAMNSDFKFYSPGMILITEVIKKCIENKEASNLNLLRGEEQYKYTMGASVYYTREYRIDF